jgi:hypothetical protein
MYLARVVSLAITTVMGVFVSWSASTGAQAPAELTLEIQDYVAMPITGKLDGKTPNETALSRVNAIREETGGAGRFFIPVVSGPLYIFDKKTKNFSTYLDFNGRGENRGIFKKFFSEAGFGNGLNGFNLDPNYARNGKFYTTHMEDPSIEASEFPQNTMFPRLEVTGYTSTPPIQAPGPVMHQGVLVEWTDNNPTNNTFEGTARELFRVWLNTRSHQLGEMIFNPAASRGDPDWRVMYLEVGDGGSGDSKDPRMRLNAQRLDTIVGKIVRIIPDLNEHKNTSTVSENGRYRIPSDNPFVKTAGARKEIWAYGLRNPHRLTWAIDPANARNNRLIANICGFQTWETVAIIHKGANHGWPLREGNETLSADGKTTALPADDKIPVMVSDTATAGTVTPIYPVIQWGHDERGGDCAGSGYLYTAKAIPALRGKYIFNDLTTGRIWYAEYKDMLAADDGDPKTMAAMRELKLVWDDPHNTPDVGKKTYDTMMPIVRAAYLQRGGKAESMNGKSRVSGPHRADVRLAVDAAGELYIYSKSDGMIRRVVSATPGQSTSEQQVLDKENERVQFRKTGKGDLGTLYTEDFLGILPSGRVLDIAAARAGKPNPNYSVSETHVRVYGNAAVMSGVQSPDPNHQVRYLRMWVKQPSGWRSVGFHETLIIPAGAADDRTALATATLSPVNTPVATTPTAQEALAVDQRYSELDRLDDSAGSRQMQTDDFFFVSRTGNVVARSASGTPSPLKELRMSDVRVRTYGDLAVITGQLQWTDQKGFSPGPLLFTRVWVRPAGQWKLAAEQRTALTATAPASD